MVIIINIGVKVYNKDRFTQISHVQLDKIVTKYIIMNDKIQNSTSRFK